MPVLHKYRNRNDYYILTSINNNIITFQLSEAGHRRLKEVGIGTGQTFPRALLFDLYRSGEVFTHGTGLDDVTDERQTTIFDLPDDPDPEKIFPSCSNCNSINIKDLHLVEIMEGGHKASIICVNCRSKRISTFDTSIPLTLVSRTILNQIIEMKEITKLDDSVKAYKELLDVEIESKWNAYRKGKSAQGILIEVDDAYQGKLI